MTSPNVTVDNMTWRADLIARQGFVTNQQGAIDTNDLKALIDKLAYVQLDSIRTVERAHHCILFARDKTYKQELLHDLTTSERRLFENWTHDACTLPMEHFSLIKLRFSRERERLVTARWWRDAESDLPALCDLVKQEITDKGALPMRHFTDLVGSKPVKPGMWQWSPIKTAVEFMWRTGEIAVSERVNFNKVYDLTERLVPKDLFSAALEEADSIKKMCIIALERLGYATVKEVADFWGFLKLAETRVCLKQMTDEGVVLSAERQTHQGETQACFVLTTSDFPTDAADIGLRILSPFDPLTRNRTRLTDLFGFDYRFEAFVPQAKRSYGYYVFPVIEDSTFIGRVNMFHQKDKSGALAVTNFWPETGVRQTKKREAALKQQLQAWAKFSGAVSLNFSEGYWR